MSQGIPWEEIVAGLDPERIRRARWFSAQDPGPVSLEFLDGIALEGALGACSPLILLVWVSPETGDAVPCMIPLRCLAPGRVPGMEPLGKWGGNLLVDASADELLQSRLHEACQENRDQRGELGNFLFRGYAPHRRRQCRAITPDASDTLILLKRDEAVKLYRRAEPGVAPELESLRFFRETEAFASMAPLTASLEYHGDNGPILTLVLATLFLENQGNLWFWTQDFLRGMLSAMPAGGTGEFVRFVTEFSDEYLTGAAKLGRTVAAMHRCLLEGSQESGFQTEPFTAEDVMLWQQGLAANVARLEGQTGDWEEETSARFRDRVSRIRAVVDRFGRLDLKGLEKCRVHQNLNLPHVLRVGKEFCIFGFEGDCTVPLIERKTKYHPLRDVATLLRSFGSAVCHALHAGLAAPPAVRTRKERLLLQWAQEVEKVMITAYFLQMGWNRGGAMDAMLAAFKLECSLSELGAVCAAKPESSPILLSAIEGCLGDLESLLVSD